MSISFTEKQQHIIDAGGHNLLVSAAAGSGKTAVLVERIVKMVSDGEHPVDIDRLLVVTFTNAAAAEMRERISNALNDRLVSDPENEHLQRQTTLLHNAKITTIDSFCLFVLRNQFHTIGLDPGFRIAEEGEIKLLRRDVLAQVLEERYAVGDSEFINCMEYFSQGRRDEAVEEIVWKLYDFAMSTPFPEEWLAQRKTDYCLPPNEFGQDTGQNIASSADTFDSIPWVADMMRRASLLLHGFEDRLDEALRMCSESDGPYMYGEILERERGMVQGLLRSCAEGYDALYTAFGALRFDRLPSKKDETVSSLKRETVKDIRTQVKEQLGELQKKFFFKSREQTIRQMENCRAAVEALADLTLAFKKAFDASKRDKNILDFDDVEHFALSILVENDENGNCVPTRTALEYRSYFHEILIDEYQDSNLVQEYILSCISGEGEGRYNRFMVGDVKQSIYKFRLARPELFLEKYVSYGQQADRENVTAEKIDLHQNFRSRREVLDSVNSVFEQLMGEDVGGIVYDEAAALHPGADYPEQALDGYNDTELLLFRTDEKPEELSAKEQEAYGVAAKIKEMLREFRVTDKESGALRPLCYRDIVILLRTVSGWDEVFKKVLEGEGIPVHMTSRTGYFAASEVQELLHFLRILDNPLQDIPLYGVLHAYLGGFGDEEIALIRAAFPKKKYLYDALKGCAEVNGGICGVTEPNQYGSPADDVPVTRQLADKISGFLSRIERYRKLAAYLSVQELLQTILRETDYLNYVAVKPEGSKRRANVEMLLVKATEYEKTSYFGLYHFLRYMEQLEKYEVDYGEAGLRGENADVVRIMSIHKSKGLEFPVCFVSGLAKGFQTRDVNGHLVLDIDEGIGVDYVDSVRRVRGADLRKNVIAEKLKTDNLAEEMRILYVAMTRAKEKLILTGCIKAPEKIAAKMLYLARRKETLLPYDMLIEMGSFMELVLAALAGNKCMDELYRTCGTAPEENSLLRDRDMSIRVTLSGWEERVEEKLEEAVRMEEAKRKLLLSDRSKDVDHTLMTRMSDNFAYRYPHDNLKNLYTKTTVSELKMAGMQEESDFSFRLYEEETVVPYLPGFLQKDERVSGSMRGSAFHKVMELFDFRELTKEVSVNREKVIALLEGQLTKMRQEGGLSEEYYDVVSIPGIAGFLMSKTAARMGEAARAGKLYKEQPFVMGLPANRLSTEFPQDETVLIQGIIDVFFEEDGRCVLLDYKTDAVETAQELIGRYHVQLDYYAEALKQSFGYADMERILYSFKLGEEIWL